jgi:hypothetical protein
MTLDVRDLGSGTKLVMKAAYTKWVSGTGWLRDEFGFA